MPWLKFPPHQCLILLLTLFIYGCNESSHDIEIHLQARYSNTPVIVFLDNSLVLADTVSTGSIIGVAEIIPMNISEGQHKLHVKANGNAVYEEEFDISSTLFVGVLYDSSQSNISFYFQSEQFYYD